MSQEVVVEVITDSGVDLPKYSTVGSAGMDIRAFINDAIKLVPMDRVLIPTGIYMAIPEGYEVQIRPRSGLAIKHGITVINSPGTIDCDYRGEVMVGLINFGRDKFEIEPNMRIAQMVLAKYERINWKIVQELPSTERGKGGYGSTGIN